MTKTIFLNKNYKLSLQIVVSTKRFITVSTNTFPKTFKTVNAKLTYHDEQSDMILYYCPQKTNDNRKAHEIVERQLNMFKCKLTEPSVKRETETRFKHQISRAHFSLGT